MKRSLLSAIVGLIAGVLMLTIVFGSRISEWGVSFVIYFMYGAPFVAVVWLCILWPLYVRVPRTSVLWHPIVCISIGAVVGVLLYFLLMWLIFSFPPDVLLSTRHLLTGAVVGAVTCIVGCYLKSHEHSTRAV